MNYRRVLLSLLLVLLLPLVSAGAQDLPDLEGRTVTVAVENAYIPFNFINQDTGQPEGWDYDALAEICGRLNCTPEFVEVSWDVMINAVSQGEYDVAADGITITEERAEIVDFSVGYIAVDQVLLVRKDEDRFTTPEELVADTSLLLGTQSGTTNFQVAVELVGEDNVNARIVAFNEFGAAIQALVNSDVDAVVIDNVAGQGYVGENSDALKVLPTSLKSDALGFIFPKGSELTAAFNAAIESMIADGTMARINAKWFPKTLPDLEGRTVTVAVENAYIPFNFINQDTGQPEGWDYDAIAEICARLNCVPEFVEVSWDVMINAVSQGEYDLAADGITITEERAEIVDFSIGYIQVDQVLLVRKGEDRFSGPEEFVANPDLLLGTQSGTTNFQVAVEMVGEENVNARVVAFNEFGAAIQALVNSDVDAVVIDNVAGQGYVGENSDVLEVQPTSLKSDALGLIFPKGSELKGAFDAAIESMMVDGTLDAINAKWFPPSEGE
jgi:polar amino acid transport system substrate-binding protein